jgi:hypothetical protein
MMTWATRTTGTNTCQFNIPNIDYILKPVRNFTVSLTGGVPYDNTVMNIGILDNDLGILHVFGLMYTHISNLYFSMSKPLT